jgi:hypothetical protein
MTRPPPFDALRGTPLRRDEQVLALVAGLLDRALRRQLWLVLLDADDRPLPVLLPSSIPRHRRDGDAERMARFLGEVVDDLGAVSFVHVYERRGPDRVDAVDRAWLRLGIEAAALASLTSRGPVLLHDEGARWIGEEDLR